MRRQRVNVAGIAVVVVALAASCGSDASTTDTAAPTSATPTLEQRLDELAGAVETWSDATELVTAQVAAETAANLIVGPGGPGYGDRNGDGTVDGATDEGVLPGLDGTPNGIATAAAGNTCVERDVLGGPWDDPAARWGEMTTAIDAWRPEANTMPALASHPMRVVGWSTFTLGSDSLDEAHEYASHAAIHVRISADALAC